MRGVAPRCTAPGVAAMGPKPLQATGELADGTLPYLAGPSTIAEFIQPTIPKAAADAGGPAPRVIAAVPVLISEDPEAARRTVAERLSFYETIPSYQKVIARERLADVTNLAAIGSVEAVVRRLKIYLDAGATDAVISPVCAEESDTEGFWEVARSIDDA
jgi:alkanesulfonate monooxygenase SsuD/methylene tetrahydromethanopterin reductase-like flavin-dependent oxidoreductase (luciferase family)